ncbi:MULTISPECIES: hypothetical protein [unclassified Microbacterium]|uniref:hypothetical protein n=1 Tax=unclassified Microbacterium TaxID=2609290 RepID=UPI000CFC30A2|nr:MULTISPECIES: hypothetical protein [unclassified Microbacterium]PRB09611.1 hypothetical protein CQ047_10015 [Microbacterium sp. MYb72]
MKERARTARIVAAGLALGGILSLGIVAPASASEIKTSFRVETTFEKSPDGKATAWGYLQWTSAYSFRVYNAVTDNCPVLGKGDGENAQLDAKIFFTDGTSKKVKISSDDNGCTFYTHGGGGYTEPRIVVKSTTKRIRGVVLILSEKNADGGYADSVTKGEMVEVPAIGNPLVNR